MFRLRNIKVRRSKAGSDNGEDIAETMGLRSQPVRRKTAAAAESPVRTAPQGFRQLRDDPTICGTSRTNPRVGLAQPWIASGGASCRSAPVPWKGQSELAQAHPPRNEREDLLIVGASKTHVSMCCIRESPESIRCTQITPQVIERAAPQNFHPLVDIVCVLHPFPDVTQRIV